MSKIFIKYCPQIEPVYKPWKLCYPMSKRNSIYIVEEARSYLEIKEFFNDYKDYYNESVAEGSLDSDSNNYSYLYTIESFNYLAKVR